MLKQKTRDWVGGRERGLTGGARNIFEDMIFFLKQNTRDESRRSGTGWVFTSKRSLRAGDQGVICVRTENQGLSGC